jgi:hypothetical protein
MLMQEVNNQNFINTEHTIKLNLQDMPRGLYLLKLTSNDQKCHSKIEIQK